jgi:hypothetical protein
MNLIKIQKLIFLVSYASFAFAFDSMQMMKDLMELQTAGEI